MAHADLRVRLATFAGERLRLVRERSGGDVAVGLARCLRAARSLGAPRNAAGRARGNEGCSGDDVDPVADMGR